MEVICMDKDILNKKTCGRSLREVSLPYCSFNPTKILVSVKKNLQENVSLMET